MIPFLCWSLIYLARAMEFTRIAWGTAVIETGLRRWTTTPLHEGRASCFLITRLGIVLLAPVTWMHPVAVALTRLANRGLPPLEHGEGFLKRLYQRRHARTA